MYVDARTGIPFYVGRGQGRRVTEHLTPKNLERKTRFYCKLRKMLAGGNRPQIEFLYVCLSFEEANRLEVMTIKKWGRLDNGTGCLTNHTDGGEGQTGRVVSDATKNKARGSKRTLAQRKTMSESAKKRKATQAQRDRQSERQKGKSVHPNMTAAAAKRSKELRRPVECCDLITGEVKTYESTAAAEADGSYSSNIVSCCKGKKSSHNGKIWRYVGEEYPTPLIDVRHKIVVGVDLSTGESKTYRTAEDTAEDGFIPAAVRNCCGGSQTSHRGKAWWFRGEIPEVIEGRLKVARNPPHIKPVQSFDPITGEITTYAKMADVVAAGFSQGNVGMCCRGERKSHLGLIWSFVNEQPGEGNSREDRVGADS